MKRDLTREEALENVRKPAVWETLECIADGRMIVSQNGRAGYLEEFNGIKYRDPDNGRKVLVPGVITLITAGYLTELCTVTSAGRFALKEASDNE